MIDTFSIIEKFKALIFNVELTAIKTSPSRLLELLLYYKHIYITTIDILLLKFNS